MKLPTLPVDKANHFVYGALIYCFAYFIFLGYQNADVLAVLCVLAVVISKELFDSFNSDSHTADVFDILATVAGCVPTFAAILSTNK